MYKTPLKALIDRFSYLKKKKKKTKQKQKQNKTKPCCAMSLYKKTLYNKMILSGKHGIIFFKLRGKTTLYTPLHRSFY